MATETDARAIVVLSRTIRSDWVDGGDVAATEIATLREDVLRLQKMVVVQQEQLRAHLQEYEQDILAIVKVFMSQKGADFLTLLNSLDNMSKRIPYLVAIPRPVFDLSVYATKADLAGNVANDDQVKAELKVLKDQFVADVQADLAEHTDVEKRLSDVETGNRHLKGAYEDLEPRVKDLEGDMDASALIFGSLRDEGYVGDPK
jgi:hypothetical protein